MDCCLLYSTMFDALTCRRESYRLRSEVENERAKVNGLAGEFRPDGHGGGTMIVFNGTLNNPTEVMKTIVHEAYHAIEWAKHRDAGGSAHTIQYNHIHAEITAIMCCISCDCK